MTANGQRLRILCVDDEQAILDAIARGMRSDYEVTTATSAADGLAAVREQPPFAIVMSDLRMPGRDGISFLAEVHHIAPDTVRLLLTGQADLDGAINAINEGHIFKFLTKPLPLPQLKKALAGAADQYRLITAERVLLEQTLQGTLKALTDILSLAQPTAFGRATRIKQRARALAERAGVPELWTIEIAAMLSQLGSITLEPQLLDKLYYGKPLSRGEAAQAARLPLMAAQLIDNIPRLEPVRDILRYTDTPYAAAGATGPVVNTMLPIGARILAIAMDFDLLEAQGMARGLALDTLQGRTGRYEPALLEQFRALEGIQTDNREVREMLLSEVTIGMAFASDVVSPNGQLLVARGQEVTTSLRERIQNYWASFATTMKVRLIVSGDRDPSAIRAESQSRDPG